MASSGAAKSKRPARSRGRIRALTSDAAPSDAPPADAAPAKGRRGWLRRIWRWIKWLFLGGLVAFALHLLVFAFAPPVSILMLERWLTGQPVTRVYKPLSEISPRLVASVIASEDSQFCRHWGVDFGAVWDILEQAWDDEEAPTRGASTITMQVTKNLYLWPLPSYSRKVLEAPLAMIVDLFWSKERIIEVYLNIAEWGPDGVIGAEAGALRAFKKSARDLSARQAAILTTSLPNPVRRNAAKPSRRQLLVANVVERRAKSAELLLDCLPEALR
jgi:monofunctional glycosyltransferase